MAVTGNNSSTKNWKFKELKCYASTEWLADNKKKYRQVFDRYETTYIYAELSFYNKLFDEDDWEVDVELRCYSMDGEERKQMCILPFTRKVGKYDNVVYIREGWGNKSEGTFWKKGNYYWEAWIEDEKVASKYFYIEDAGEPMTNKNSYISLQSLKLYEGPYDDVSKEDRVYYSQFSSEETRYIYAEIVLKNELQGIPWRCELFTKFYNDARELKGQVVRLQPIEENDELIKITAGWGSNVKGSWRQDRYSTEIVFMDKLLAVIPFEVDVDHQEGNNPVYLPNRKMPLIITEDDTINKTFEELMAELDDMIGLREIKKQVRDHAKYIQFLQLRKDKGFEEKEDVNIHSVFSGNPGTGKTTVARMIGKLYYKMGLLSRGHVHEVDRVDLVGEYIGQTAPKVKEAIKKARGGVLFIDEAYSLARAKDDNKDFGREVIEILVKEMSNGKGDLAVIVAGYPKEMEQFLEINPGLRSRFKHQFEFSDYLPQELVEIGHFAAKDKGVNFSDEARAVLDQLIVKAFRNRDKTFGNARFVHDLVEKSKIQLGLRIMSHEDFKDIDKALLASIEAQDVMKIKLDKIPELPHIPIDESLLDESLTELNRMIGMNNIKEQIHEMVRLVRYYRRTGRDVINNFSLHTVFVGNPGTGKTTVARILASIYKALGILERGHIIETDKQGLVAGFVGQTAIKTSEKIDEAKGGVLYIDEAYALSQRTGGAHGDFGDEAIQTILKRMEDERGLFFVFVAGYPDNMELFLKANPGLSSRFDKTLQFEDYNPEEMMSIALMMLREKSILPTEAAKEYLAKYLGFVHEFRDKFFGNARTVRQIVDEAVKQQNLRLSDAKSLVEGEDMVLELEDLSKFKMDKDSLTFNKKRGIGFGR